MRSDPLGSIWRRWDVHFHTPASFEYKDKSVTADQLIDGLVAAAIEVVAVTDHHRVDPALIQAMRKAAGDRVTVLPGLELRSELGGKESVHYVGIFSEDWDVAELWTKLQGVLGMSPADVAKRGDDIFYVPFEKGAGYIRELGGIVTVHAGAKTNSIENLSNADIVKRAVKADLAHRYIDALEVGRVSDCDDYRKIVFPHIGMELPLVMGSDNHNIHAYEPKSEMWIKADPGFRGLLQARNEPEARVWLGDRPPLLERTRAASTKYIAGITFTKIDASVTDSWFSGSVPLNPGLIAIIGNKGGGKSALADVLALTANSWAQKHFAFLNKDHFLRSRGGFGSAFEASATWLSGESRTCRLDASTNLSSPELVKYLPQSYVEDLCARVHDSGVSDFERELEQVIYSHVGAAQRLGKPTLRELISYLTAETAQGIQQLLRQVSQMNEAILQLQYEASEEFRARLQGRLDQRIAESVAHDTGRPEPIPEPQLDEATQQELAKVSATVAALREELKAVEQTIAEVDVADQDAAEMIAAADRLRTRIANLKAEYDYFLEESEEDFATLDLKAADVIILSIPAARLEAVDAQAKEERARAAQQLDPSAPSSSARRRQQIYEGLSQELPKLDEPGIRYQQFLEANRRWLDHHELLIGSPDAPDSIRGLEAQLQALTGLPLIIQGQLERRDQLVVEIFRAKQTLLESDKQLYGPVQAFIGRQAVACTDQGRLEFTARIAVDGFADDFLAQIHKGRRGSFQGDAEGRELVDQLIAATDFDSEAGVVGFVHEVLQLLETDKKTGHSVRLEDQLVQGGTPSTVLNFVCGLGYLRPKFALLWSGKTLPELSPGERGTLLLLFYLLVDLRDIPLIIDQPEENLDNQTVYTLLVEAVRESAQRRQIILVTHNPNLAVVCDADQVIYAHRDPARGNEVTYTTGALENPEITKLVVDVLEGTKPAFKKRDAKYAILDVN